MPLSELGIRKLKAPKPGKRREKFDREIPGFGIRITGKGARSFILLYSFAGIRRRYTIGRVGEFKIEDAREKARELRGQIRQGRDPCAEQKATRAAQKTAQAVAKAAPAPVTFREAVDIYEKRKLGNLRRGRAVRQTIDKHLLPTWGDMPLTAITRDHVRERVEALVDAEIPEAGRRVLEVSQRLFSWAIARGTFGIEESPCEKLRAKDLVGKRSLRDRVLTDPEWRALFRAVQRMDLQYRSIVELLALTGLRRNEVSDARWSEFDLGKREWVIPGERMKNGAAHVVPLIPRMVEIINSLPRTSKEFLFPNNRRSRPFTSFTVAKEKLDALMLEDLRREDPEAELKGWVIHDVRRSMRTRLSELPVPGGDLVRELLLAHTKPGLHKVYDQYAYMDERRRGYELWAEKLAAILENRQADVIDLAERANEGR
jgi:integrase